MASRLSPEPLGWALPCTPYAGPGVGLYAVPPIGASIWVEFEGGDPESPIWSGCFWNAGETPAAATDPSVTVLQVGNASVVFGPHSVSSPGLPRIIGVPVCHQLWVKEKSGWSIFGELASAPTKIGSVRL